MLASSLRLLRDVSVALLVEAGDEVHVGSGLLVCLPERPGDPSRVVVATAGHNLDGLAPGPRALRAVRVVPRGRYRADPLRVLALGLAPSGGPDVAWVEVDARDVTRRGLQALHWSYLERRAESEVLTVYGYPACHLRGAASVHGTRFDLLAAALAASRTVCAHRPDDVVVRWTAPDVHPRGLSGCGLWAQIDGRAVPVALARAWHGGRGVLYGTPMSAWLRWAAETTSTTRPRIVRA